MTLGAQHEVLEAFIGAKDNKEKGGSGNAINDKAAYDSAHKAAKKLKGSGYRREGVSTFRVIGKIDTKAGTARATYISKKNNKRVILGRDIVKLKKQ